MLLPATARLDLTPHLEHFAEHGYACLGPVLEPKAIQQLAERADALMLSPEPFPGLFYQHDSPSGLYEDLDFGAGWVGPSSRYRKIERLERVPLFAAFIENALFGRIARALLGDEVALYRTVLWNKAAGGGMAVPWHQDDGRFWGLDRAPALQLWTALDDAPLDAGCLELVPGTHRQGLATPEGGTISHRCLTEVDAERACVALPARRGECILVHNHAWHRTGRNRRGVSRRAVSVSLLDGATRCTRKRRAPRVFKRLFLD